MLIVAWILFRNAYLVMSLLSYMGKSKENSHVCANDPVFAYCGNDDIFAVLFREVASRFLAFPGGPSTSRRLHGDPVHYFFER